MSIKLETILDYFLFFIIFTKIIFALSFTGDVVAKHSDNYTLNEILDPRFVYWKERTEFIFIVCMSLLLIIHFNPYYPIHLDKRKDTTFLFFIFGIILLMTAKWGLFFKQAKWYPIFTELLR
jgi:hypothetical protein|uniref:Uncharacterized protein n=1 Tax=viral metagenome TaxID=1070528 RepID=A0A6C0KSF3_9ZZZZ